MSNVLQLFSHSIPFAAGPLAEQLKNSMGGAQAAEKKHDNPFLKQTFCDLNE